MGERLGVEVLDRAECQLLTHESLKGRLATNELQTGESYMYSLTRAQRVLQRQSGIVWLWQGLPIYALQDIHGDRKALVKFLDRKVPTDEGEIPLFDALRQGRAN